MLSNLPNKTVLGERWETVNIVGSGACAQVYKVRSTSNAVDYDLVAKVVPFAKSKSDKVQDRICNTLNYEYMMYNGLLSGFPFCPRVPPKFYGDDANLKVRYMVMEQMDRDLEAVSKDSTAPSPSAIAHYGLQILEGLKWIHQRNFIFVDVKPANFMLKKEKLYFVDFGLVERLKVMPAGKTEPGRQFSGTPTFSSIAAFNGEQPGAHDDLEAMGLVLLSLTMGGILPWSSAKSDAEIKQMKDSCDIKKLSAAHGVPEIGEIVTLCRAAVRTNRPDYDAIQHLLNAMSTRKSAPKSAAKSVAAAASSSSSGRGKAAKAASVVEAPPAAAQPEPLPKPLTAAAQKRAAAKLAADAAAAAAAAEEAAAEELPPARASPVSKRSRTSRTAAAPTEPAPSAPPAAPAVARTVPAAAASGVPSSSQKSARPAAIVTGPFSASSSSSSAVVDLVDAASPALSTRGRTRLSNSSSVNPEEPTGPFSAAYKLSDRRTSRGRSLSPVPAKGPAARATSSQSSSKATTAVATEAAEAAVSFEFRVIKGPCKGHVFSVTCPAAAVEGSTAKRSRSKAASGSGSVVKTVGREGECDIALAKDKNVSERHFSVTVTKEQVAYLEDLGSTNGTSLNGDAVTANTLTELSDGDVIRVGKSEIVCSRS